VLKKPFDNIEALQLANLSTEKWDEARTARLKLDQMTYMVEDRTREIRDYAGALESANIPETIQSDPARLRQVLINLLGNAVKFTEQGSVRLAVSFQPQQEDRAAMLCFAVQDTGIGMSAAQIAGLF